MKYNLFFCIRTHKFRSRVTVFKCLQILPSYVLKFYWIDLRSFLLDYTFLFVSDPDYSIKQYNQMAMMVETWLPFCYDTAL